jgi:hypothetical protein
MKKKVPCHFSKVHVCKGTKTTNSNQSSKFNRKYIPHVVGLKHIHVALIDQLFVFCPVEKLSLILGRHNCGWRTANLDLCLVLPDCSSDGSFMRHCCVKEFLFKVIPKDSWFSLPNATVRRRSNHKSKRAQPHHDLQDVKREYYN